MRKCPSVGNPHYISLLLFVFFSMYLCIHVHVYLYSYLEADLEVETPSIFYETTIWPGVGDPPQV